MERSVVQLRYNYVEGLWFADRLDTPCTLRRAHGKTRVGAVVNFIYKYGLKAIFK